MLSAVDWMSTDKRAFRHQGSFSTSRVVGLISSWRAQITAGLVTLQEHRVAVAKNQSTKQV